MEASDSVRGVAEEIVRREWALFQKANNRGGRASCQDDPATFSVMRGAQFAWWSREALESYLDDLAGAEAAGRNPLAEKYGYMMESTHPAEFEEIRDMLPAVTPEKRRLVEAVVRAHVAWEAECDVLYPHVRASGRPLRSSEDTPWATSFETYLRGELSTYSERTLRALLDCAERAAAAGENLARRSLDETARAYGFGSVEELERRRAAAARASR